MDAVERLPFDTVLGASLSASEHVQRYRWTAEMIDGLRVLDLCCGVGYGTAILRERAASVHGVDYDPDTIREATTAAERAGTDVTFELADALRTLDGDLSEKYDAIVCFEGLEHLPDLDHALERLAVHASRGMRLFLSVPNSRTFQEDNEFHITNLDYEGAIAAFGRFQDATVLYQYTAEGTLISDGASGEQSQAQLLLPDRSEPEYANTYLCLVNVPGDDIQSSAALMRLTLAPHQTRELRNLARANSELWGENRRLGRQLSEIVAQVDAGEIPLSILRRLDTAASSQLVKLTADAAEVETLREEVARLGVDSGEAWRRYWELRNRRIVKIALKLSRFLPL